MPQLRPRAAPQLAPQATTRSGTRALRTPSCAKLCHESRHGRRYGPRLAGLWAGTCNGSSPTSCCGAAPASATTQAHRGLHRGPRPSKPREVARWTGCSAAICLAHVITPGRVTSGATSRGGDAGCCPACVAVPVAVLSLTSSSTAGGTLTSSSTPAAPQAALCSTAKRASPSRVVARPVDGRRRHSWLVLCRNAEASHERCYEPWPSGFLTGQWLGSSPDGCPAPTAALATARASQAAPRSRTWWTGGSAARRSTHVITPSRATSGAQVTAARFLDKAVRGSQPSSCCSTSGGMGPHFK